MDEITFLFEKLSDKEKTAIIKITNILLVLKQAKEIVENDAELYALILIYLLLYFTDEKIKHEDSIFAGFIGFARILGLEINEETTKNFSKKLSKIHNYLTKDAPNNEYSDTTMKVVATNFLINKYGNLKGLKEKIAQINN